MTFKQLMVMNVRKKKVNSSKHYKVDKLLQDLHAQIENSLELGWDPKDILVFSNIAHEHMGIQTIIVPLNETCLTGSKCFAMQWALRFVDFDVLWAHDLDAWQCCSFDPPEFKDIGLAEYSRPKYNGGSVFIRPSAGDIIDTICSTLVENDEAREEPTLDRLLRGPFEARTTTLNNTWNVGCSGFVPRIERAEKPLCVAHFHPAGKHSWNTFVRNKHHVPKDCLVPRRLRDLFLRHYRDRIEKNTYEDGLGIFGWEADDVSGET